MMWGMGMPPPGFSDLIARKYSMEQQRTDAQVGQAAADTNLTNIKAGLMPAESAATVGRENALTAGQNITNRFLPASLNADILGKQAQTGQTQAQTGLIGYQALLAKQATMPSMFGMVPTGYDSGL